MFAEITSANVVGYQAVETEAGMALITSTFKAITGDYKISDIKIEGAEGIGDEYAQVINSDGTWGDMYVYLTEDGVGCDTGWYKDAVGDEPVTDDDVIKLGQGLSFSCGADVTITYAGEVVAGIPTVEVDAGMAMIGNPTPVLVKISAVTVDGGEGIGDEYAQKINSDGTWGDMYVYLTEDGVGCDTGWYKDAVGDEPVTDDDVLAPGQSVSFSTGSDVTITFPAIIVAE